MQLIFLGSGSAFTVGGDNYQSNMMLVSPRGKRMLIDCGSDARFALFDLGLNHRDISDIYISHLHADHVGGLEWIAFTSIFDQPRHRIKLHAAEVLYKPLWENVLCGGLSSLQGKEPSFDIFFDLHPIRDNSSFEWEGIRFSIVQTIHALCGYKILPSYGIKFTSGKHKVFITTDTQFAPHQIIDFYEEATVIFQDCETAQFASGVHAHYNELITLPDHIKNKMWLYHYQPGPLPNAKKDGFIGFVAKGQSFNF